MTSGVQGALHLVDELAGPEEAQRVADLHPELGWTPADSTDDPRGPLRGPGLARRGSTTSSPGSGPPSGSPWATGSASWTPPRRSRCTASPRRPAPSPSLPTDTVRTRHGLVLLTTRTEDAPHLSRLVVPGGGFTAALQDLADHTDAATAVATAKMIGYPTPTSTWAPATDRAGRFCSPSSASCSLPASAPPARVIRRRRRRRTSAQPRASPVVTSSGRGPRPRADHRPAPLWPSHSKEKL